MQFYSGNFLGGKDGGKDEEGFTRRQGLCLEDQRCPDAMNKRGLGPYLLVPGLPYQKATRLEFYAVNELDDVFRDIRPIR
jgi:aldose 1-epimerase